MTVVAIIVSKRISTIIEKLLTQRGIRGSDEDRLTTIDYGDGVRGNID